MIDDKRTKSLIWGASWTFVYVIVQFIIKIGRGLVIPFLLVPAAYGLWSSLGVLLRYVRYADLGVQAQLSKRLPYLLGKKGESAYWNLAKVGLSWNFCVSICVFTILFLASYLYQGNHAQFYQSALRLLAFVILLQNLRNVFVALLNAWEEFKTVTIQGILVDSFNFLFAVVGVLWIGVLGLVWALLLSEIIGIIYCLYRLIPFGLKQYRWKLQGVVATIREGLVLLAVAFLETLMMTIDQIFLLRYFSKAQYGIYALGLFLVSTLIAVSAIFVTHQPRILSLAGKGQVEKSMQLVEANLVLYTLVIVLCIPFFQLLTDLLVHFYLDKYTTGIAFYVLMPIIALARGPVIILRGYFIALHKERHVIMFQILGLALAAILNMITIWQGGGFFHIILASTLGYLLTGILMSIHFEKGWKKKDNVKYFILIINMLLVILMFAFYYLRSPLSTDVLTYIGYSLTAFVVYTTCTIIILYVTRNCWLPSVRFYLEGAQHKLPIRLKKWLYSTDTK